MLEQVPVRFLFAELTYREWQRRECDDTVIAQMNCRAAGTRFQAMRPRVRPPEFRRFCRRRGNYMRRAEFSRLRRRRGGCGLPRSAIQLIGPIDRWRMNRIVFSSGSCGAWLTQGPRLIQGGNGHALPHEGLRTGCGRGASCHAFRHVESKVCEFQTGGCRPDLERPRSRQKQPAYTGVERSDDDDDP
jgi:hypothetical protein